MRTVIYILQKEFIQVFRNKLMLPIIFVVPIVQLVVLVFAASLDMKNIESAHKLYLEKGLGARDDAIAMQYLIPGWTFNNKKPCMVR